MTKQDVVTLILDHRDELIAQMKLANEDALYNPGICAQIYIWSTGEVIRERDRGCDWWMQVTSNETRELFHVASFYNPVFNAADVTTDFPRNEYGRLSPDNETRVIADLVAETNYDDYINIAIADIERNYYEGSY